MIGGLWGKMIQSADYESNQTFYCFNLNFSTPEKHTLKYYTLQICNKKYHYGDVFVDLMINICSMIGAHVLL